MGVQTGTDLLSVTLLPALLAALFPALQMIHVCKCIKLFSSMKLLLFLFGNLPSLKENKLTGVCLGFLDPWCLSSD